MACDLSAMYHNICIFRDTGSLNPSDGGSWWQSWGRSFVDTVKEKVFYVS